jgi:hypothetical protein
MHSTTARLVAALTALMLIPAATASARGADADATRKAENALTKLERIAAGRTRLEDGREYTGLLRELAVGYRGLGRSERGDARSFLARPDNNPSGSDPPFATYSAGQPAGLLCDSRFCVHYSNQASDPDAPNLTDGPDAGTSPDYIDATLQALSTSADRENGQLGWPAAASDGNLGGNALTDVYVLDLDIAQFGILGYAAPDPSATQTPGSISLHSYLVLDNDYAAPGLTDPNGVRDVTIAHEYNHVLQYSIDVLQDGWAFEATAVWMEDQVFPASNDYASFLPTWVTLSQVPLTTFTQDLTNPASEKAYGDAVWNHWIANRYGADAVLQSWLGAPATTPAHFSLGAWENVILTKGGPGFATEFACFAAATGEWRSMAPDNCAGRSGLFPDAASANYPDMTRVSSAPTVDGSPINGTLSHTAFAMFNLPAGPATAYKLIGDVAAGTSAAIAFIGRKGDPSTGQVTLRVAEMTADGTGSVLVEAPASFTRLTAVLINSDSSQSGFSGVTKDWAWIHDNQTASIRLSSDVTPPVVTSRSPAPNVSNAPVTTQALARFSERVVKADGTSVLLRSPGGKAVPADVALDAAGTQVTLVPKARLAQRTRYTVQLTNAISDGSDNRLAPESWSFTTVNLPPAFTLSAPSRQRAKDVRKRGVKVLVRSTDSERLSLTMKALAPGKRAGRSKKQTLRPGARRTVRLPLSPAASAALAAGRAVKVKVRVDARDPSGKRKSRTRTIKVSA